MGAHGDDRDLRVPPASAGLRSGRSEQALSAEIRTLRARIAALDRNRAVSARTARSFLEQLLKDREQELRWQRRTAAERAARSASLPPPPRPAYP